MLASSQHELQGGFKYRGLLRTVYVISAEEGVRSLYGGLAAALQRQLVFASIRLGYYDRVKQFYIENVYGPCQTGLENWFAKTKVLAVFKQP